MKLTAKQRTLIRQAAGCKRGDNFPEIRIQPGYKEPIEAGRGFYWTTPSGKTEIMYPNAYKWPKWYHNSERHIVVGAAWLLSNC